MHYNIPYPIKSLKPYRLLELNDNLFDKETLAKSLEYFILKYLSVTSGLVQLFGHYCSIIIIEDNNELFFIQELPIAYVKKKYNHKNIIMLTLEYGFCKFDNRLHSFPIVDPEFGFRSLFLHPIYTYYPKNTMNKKNHEKKMLCVCGRWGGSDYIKKYTICEVCHHKAICSCGREETLKYWKNDYLCPTCIKTINDDKKQPEGVQPFLRKSRVEPGISYEYHSMENAFISYIDRTEYISYSNSLHRFLRAILVGETYNIIPVINEKIRTRMNNKALHKNYYGEKVTYPIRPCFFTYDTFFFVRCRKYQPSIECALSFKPRIVRVLKNYQSTIDEMIANFKKYSKG